MGTRIQRRASANRGRATGTKGLDAGKPAPGLFLWGAARVKLTPKGLAYLRRLDAVRDGKQRR